MAGPHPPVWFGFGFCGFGQVPGSGRGRQVLRPQRLLDADICRVSAGWSYTAVLTGAGRLQLSGSADGAAGGCKDVWASEELLVLLRSRPGPGPRTELQAWAPGAALRGEPRWTRLLEGDGEPGGGSDGQHGPLPLLPGARAYVSPRPPHCRPLGPELRARRLELGAEHALLLDAAGQVFSWGAGRHGQLGHGTLEPAPEPRPLEALQGLRMAAVAAGGWHSVCVSEAGDLYVWGWNEAGQLGLPARGLEEPQETVAKAPSPGGDAAAEDRAGADPASYIAVQPFPALLDLPSDSDAIAASCGSRHTVAVTRTGELYTWGWGKYGQLGHVDTASLDRPCRVQYFTERRLRVRAVSCGPWSTFVCTEEEPRAAP